MKKGLLTGVILCFFVAFTLAQGTYQPKANNGTKGVVYNKEFTVDARLHTNGIALAANIAKIQTYYKTTYYHIEIGELKHPKEYRYSRDLNSGNFNQNSSSFVYGKQNSFFVLRGGYGTKRYFSEKARRKGLAIGINYEFGPSLGILKPYYLKVRSGDFGNGPRDLKFSQEEAASFLDADGVFGYSGFSKGLLEVSVIPGGNAKFGVHFDWGAFDEYVKAVEVGIMADFYFQKIPIMVDEASFEVDRDVNNQPIIFDIVPQDVRNRPFFINLYVSLQLGKRW